MPTVLVVDDSRISRRIIAKALRDAGHTIVEASDGVEAIEAYRKEAFDCVCTDLLMPNMDGFELIEEIRKVDKALPILVASADIQDSSHERCHKLGISGLITKPAKADVLASAVANALQTHEAPVG